MYSEWEKTTTIPSSLDVAGKGLTQPQYQQALCALVVNLTSGKTSGDIDVLNYKPADHPERDSYDAETIAVTGEESVATVATKMLQAMKEKGQVPNQTLFTRNGQAIALLHQPCDRDSRKDGGSLQERRKASVLRVH